MNNKKIVLRIMITFLVVGISLFFYLKTTAKSITRVQDITPPLGWVDGTPQIFENYRGIIESTKVRNLSQQELREAGLLSHDGVVEDIPIGTEEGFWAFDIANSIYYSATATLIASSSTTYVYVENSESVPESTALELMSAFDEMIPEMHDFFGTELDVNSDSKITILLLDVRDGYSGAEASYVAGYFNPIDELVDEENSNKREMIYIDTNPSDPNSTRTKGVLAHEYQHLIHFKYDNAEEIWFNEGLSDLAIYLTGYDHSINHVNAFVTNTDKDLTVWNNELSDYGAAYMFMLYLYEQYPSRNSTPLSRWLVFDPEHGIEGVEKALEASGYYGINFNTVFHNWSITLGLNNRGINSLWGYRDLSYYLNTNRQNYWFSPVEIGGEEEPSPVAAHANDYLQVRFLNPLDYSKTFQVDFEGDIGPNFSFFELEL